MMKVMMIFCCWEGYAELRGMLAIMVVIIVVVRITNVTCVGFCDTSVDNRHWVMIIRMDCLWDMRGKGTAERDMERKLVK